MSFLDELNWVLTKARYELDGRDYGAGTAFDLMGVALEMIAAERPRQAKAFDAAADKFAAEMTERMKRLAAKLRESSPNPKTSREMEKEWILGHCTLCGGSGPWDSSAFGRCETCGHRVKANTGGYPVPERFVDALISCKGAIRGRPIKVDFSEQPHGVIYSKMVGGVLWQAKEQRGLWEITKDGVYRGTAHSLDEAKDHIENQDPSNQSDARKDKLAAGWHPFGWNWTPPKPSPEPNPYAEVSDGGEVTVEIPLCSASNRGDRCKLVEGHEGEHETVNGTRWRD